MKLFNFRKNKKPLISSPKGSNAVNISNVAGMSDLSQDVIWKTITVNNGVGYIPLQIFKLEGGVEYKLYVKLLERNVADTEVAYSKLVFPNSTSIIMTSLSEFSKLIQQKQILSITRFQFLECTKETALFVLKSKYLYIAKVDNFYFDIPENMAKELLENLKISLTLGGNLYA